VIGSIVAPASNGLKNYHRHDKRTDCYSYRRPKTKVNIPEARHEYDNGDGQKNPIRHPFLHYPVNALKDVWYSHD
jgi:hypothetical protein